MTVSRPLNRNGYGRIPTPLSSELVQGTVQPWTVCRYRNSESVDKWKDDFIVRDMALAAKNRQI